MLGPDNFGYKPVVLVFRSLDILDLLFQRGNGREFQLGRPCKIASPLCLGHVGIGAVQLVFRIGRPLELVLFGRPGRGQFVGF